MINIRFDRYIEKADFAELDCEIPGICLPDRATLDIDSLLESRGKDLIPITAWSNGTLVGNAACIRKHEIVGGLAGVKVRNGLRGCGLGRQLLIVFDTVAVVNSYPVVAGWTGKHNYGFYQRFGYKVRETGKGNIIWKNLLGGCEEVVGAIEAGETW